MASKRKANGCTSVRCVEEAMQKCNCGVLDFFIHATTAERSPPEFNAELAAEHFTRFRHDGSAMYPHYEIPKHILRFADMVHSSKCPLQLIRDLRVSARASAPAPAHVAVFA